MRNFKISSPVILCGGLTKKYGVPGWRVGWALLYGPNCDKIKVGIENLLKNFGSSANAPG